MGEDIGIVITGMKKTNNIVCPSLVPECPKIKMEYMAISL